MKKNELMNGDVVVLRSGSIAVVIGNGKDAFKDKCVLSYQSCSFLRYLQSIKE